MTLQKINTRSLLVTLFILLVAAVRVGINSTGKLHALTSFSPIGAIALFGAAYFTKSSASLAVPLFTLFISDTILALTVYSKYSHGILYGGWYWVYGAFVLMIIAGKWLLKEVTVKNALLAALSITFIHWVLTDIGVWLGSTFYPQTLSGFWACLAAAIPFERNFLLGTLFYSAIMFGAFEWLLKRYRPVAMAS